MRHIATPSVHVQAPIGHIQPVKSLIINYLLLYTKGLNYTNLALFVNSKNTRYCKIAH